MGRVRVQDVAAHGTAPVPASAAPAPQHGGPVVTKRTSDRVTIEKMTVVVKQSLIVY